MSAPTDPGAILAELRAVVQTADALTRAYLDTGEQPWATHRDAVHYGRELQAIGQWLTGETSPE